MRGRAGDFFWLCARLFVGFVFAYAGYSKLMEPIENFRGVLAEYRAIPYAAVPAIAAVLPWLELFSGGFLLAGFAMRPSAAAAALICLGFLVVLSASHIFYGSVPASCGCFGESGIHLTVLQVFFLDLTNLGLSLGLSLQKRHFLSLDALLH